MTTDIPTLVLATTNAGKVAEFRALLASLLDLSRVRLATPSDLGCVVPPLEEEGATFAQNASLKAIHYAAATGCPALADDSGLCVDALCGAPGLYSARWAGTSATDSDRSALLLEKLQGVPPSLRTARFVCAAAVAAPGGPVSVSEGRCEGVIAPAPRGDAGFGYDPIFRLPECDATMAELSPHRKNQISHRALALKALSPALVALMFPAQNR